MKYQLIVSTDDPQELARIAGTFAAANLGETSTVALAAAAPAATSYVAPSPGPGFVAPTVEPDDGAPAAYVPGEVDANGIPWDERIHTSTHAKNADGTWRRKRNVDDATFAALTAELKARGMTVQTPAAPVAAPAAAPVPFAAPSAVAQPAPVAFAPTAAVPMPAAAPAPAPVAAAPAPAPVATPGAVDFPTLMQIVGAGVQSGKINQEYLTWLGNNYGFGTNIGAVAGNAELIGRIHAQLQVDGRL